VLFGGPERRWQKINGRDLCLYTRLPYRWVVTVSTTCQRRIDLAGQPSDGTSILARDLVAQRVHQPQPGIGPELLERCDFAQQRYRLRGKAFGGLPAAGCGRPCASNDTELCPDVAAPLGSGEQIGKAQGHHQISPQLGWACSKPLYTK